MGRTLSTTHRWLFCRALYLQPSDDKRGSAANKVCVVKRRCLLGDKGLKGNKGDQRDDRDERDDNETEYH